MSRLLFCKKSFHKSDTYVKAHSHTCHEIVFYGYKSSGVTRIDNDEYEFKEGDIVLNPAHTFHDETHHSAGELIYFGFEADNIPAGRLFEGMMDLKHLFYELYDELNNQRPFYERILELKINEILLHLERRLVADNGYGKNISYCKTFLSENYTEKISIVELAATVGYSADHFRHLFSKKYGLSPKEFLITKRVEKACLMLKTTDHSCTEIAGFCGFSDSAQMSKIVKKHTGFSPNAIRQTRGV